MKNKTEQCVNNPEFLEFLNREFNEIAVDATKEEIAEFAFGSLEKAIESFDQRRKT